VQYNHRVFKWLIGLISLYALGYLFCYWQTPVGQTPVLDGAENVLLADKIFSDTLAREPFYRAMLYPAFLAIFRFLGFAVEDINSIAAISGIMLHVLNSIIAGFIALFLWKNQRSMFLAMLLYGFYPVALHFAADPLDITMAIFFLSASFLMLLAAINNNDRRLFALSGLLLGTGSVLRANMLPAAGILVLLLPHINWRRGALMALGGLLLPVLLGGLLNYMHSGRFLLMPWQGAFNLYAANYQQANGKYFKQTILLPDRDLSRNPARMESEIIFSKDHPNKTSYTVEEFNSYWHHQTIKAIKSDPGAWLKLMGKKIYYLFNNYEQYNNKTYSFYKQLSPVLKYNPLGFGILLILSILALVNLKRDINLKLLLQAITLLSMGILAFYVSARFRILLLPFVVALAAGCAHLNKPQLLSRKSLIAIILTAFITFSGFFAAADTSTWNSDRLLLAHASSRINDYAGQIHWADEVLNNDPQNLQAIRLKLVGFTNLALMGKFTNQQQWQQVAPQIGYLKKHEMFFTDTLFLGGSYFFSVENQGATAEKLWRLGLENSQQKDLFHAALIIAGFENADETMFETAQSSPLLWYALHHAGLVAAGDDPSLKVNAAAIKFLFNLNQ
jgi:4-amino-4-deoxy-L-arabinose transferase-like glycosyltransferase